MGGSRRGGQGKATVAKVATSVTKKTKGKATSNAQKKQSPDSTQKERQKETSPVGADIDEDEFLKRARQAYEREQERIQANAKALKKQCKEIQERRLQDWLKDNPGKTKYQYQKFQKERHRKQIEGIRAQSKFLRMKQLSKRATAK